MEPEKMTEQEIKDFDALYQYIKTEILGYKITMALPSYMALKMKEIANGRNFARLDAVSKHTYTFKDALDTLKFYKFKLKQGMVNTIFNDERHKFNYIHKFIMNNINDVVIINEKARKLREKTERESLEHLTENEAAKYTPKDTGNPKNEKLNKMW